MENCYIGWYSYRMSEGDPVPKPKTPQERAEIERKAKQWSELLDAEKSLQVLENMSDEALKKAVTNTRAELEKPIRNRIERLRKQLGLAE